MVRFQAQRRTPGDKLSGSVGSPPEFKNWALREMSHLAPSISAENLRANRVGNELQDEHALGLLSPRWLLVGYLPMLGPVPRSPVRWSLRASSSLKVVETDQGMNG